MHDVNDAPLDAVPSDVLYRILGLRSEVFVVEQTCLYLDVDGRDAEPDARLLWIADDAGAVVATARVLREPGGGTRIGRVATAAAARGQGLAGRLVDHAIASTDGPWVLDAQSHLADWYAGRGFEVSGPEFVEDGIPHIPMRRA